ncbi:hypothetical protein ACIBP6_23965 [Nonomuraea terrae]|uniref:hypothetical protein n=1 Tax=Nonomuraea terrae TaxID=2530383 RepID=UPI00378C561E
MRRNASPALSGSGDVQLVEIDVERDREPVMKEDFVAGRCRERRRRLVVDFFDPPVMRDAGHRVENGLASSVAYRGIGGDHFDSRRNILGLEKAGPATDDRMGEHPVREQA